MRQCGKERVERASGAFYVTMADSNLINYYRTITELIAQGYDPLYIDTLIPWELDIMISLLKERLKRIKDAQGG